MMPHTTVQIIEAITAGRGRLSMPDIITTVNRSEIEAQLMTLIRKEKSIPDELMKPETTLAEAGIDSLDSLTILFAIEEHFQMSVPDEAARSVRTFGDLIDLVEREK